jgi:hypothetical protein
MMMLSFNYTSLDRGFESISLRCQYCKADETRPWPRQKETAVPDGHTATVVADDPVPQSPEAEAATDEPQSHAQEVATGSEPEPPGPSDDARLPNVDASSESSDPVPSSNDDYERMRMRFAGLPPLTPEAPDTT